MQFLLKCMSETERKRKSVIATSQTRTDDGHLLAGSFTSVMNPIELGTLYIRTGAGLDHLAMWSPLGARIAKTISAH